MCAIIVCSIVDLIEQLQGNHEMANVDANENITSNSNSNSNSGSNSNSNSNSNCNETKKKSNSQNNSKQNRKNKAIRKKKHQKSNTNKEKKPRVHTTDNRKEQSPSQQKHNNKKKQNQSKNQKKSKNSSKKRDYDMECHNDKSDYFDAPPKKKQRNSMSVKEKNDNQPKLSSKSTNISRSMSKIVQNVEMSRVDAAKLLKNLKQTFKCHFQAFKTTNGQIKVNIDTAGRCQFLFSSFVASITIDSVDLLATVRNKIINPLFGVGTDMRVDTQSRDGQTILLIRWMPSDSVTRNYLIHHVDGLQSPSIKLHFKAFYDDIDQSQVSKYVSSCNTATGEGKLTIQGFVLAALNRCGLRIRDDQLTNVIKQSYRTTLK